MLEFLFDGAFGTYFFSKNDVYELPELANLSDEKLVTEIHREYIEAGATAIRTNTFGVNTCKIEDWDLCENLLRRGYQLAVQATEYTDVCVFADMGPNNGEHAEEEYLRATDIFLQEGAKHFIFETQDNMDDLRKAVNHIKAKVPNGFIIVSFGVGQDGFSKSGEYFERLFDKAVDAGADVVGLNCVCGPTHLLNLIKKVPSGKYRLSVMPNSGYPTDIGGRTVYSVDNPDYFARKLSELYSLGVRILGGCCGTTPEHIRRTAVEVKDAALFSVTAQSARISQPSVKTRDFEKKFIAVEIDPPNDTSAEYIIRAAKQAKQAGADFVTIPDSPLGKIRANSLMIAALVQRRAGIPAIPHLCCRDKNNIAIKGDLIAASIEGVSRVLAITGDALKESDSKHTKSVFGFNSFKLISYIKNLNEVTFVKDPYSVCGALNIDAKNFEAELVRAEKKIENGVDCLFTQPIFSDRHLENYFYARKHLDCKIAAGIMPLAGYKNALFLSNEVPGIEIPQAVINRLKDADPAQTKEICLAYSKDILNKIGKNCDGFYIMTPLKKIDFSTELVAYIQELWR